MKYRVQLSEPLLSDVFEILKLGKVLVKAINRMF